MGGNPPETKTVIDKITALLSLRKAPPTMLAVEAQKPKLTMLDKSLKL